MTMNNKEIFKECAGHTSTVTDEVILKMMEWARTDERAIALQIAEANSIDKFSEVQRRNKAGSEMDERWCPHKKDICNR